MSTEPDGRIVALLEEAFQRPPDERADFVDDACGHETDLADQLKAMLALQTEADRVLDAPTTDTTTYEAALGSAEGRRQDPEPGQRSDSMPTETLRPVGPVNLDVGVEADSPDPIPGYTILKELHRGGQGVVYQAIQESPKRKVALKVMLEGPFAGPVSKRRFEREIELVGSLRHPGIVPIFDSGVAGGRFFYAMEYIRGEPLAAYVQSRTLSVNDTLRLFAKVCDAVDYAHQRGVIHRDLKPSNILVDERGDAHVLDFGLAKIAGADALGDGHSRLLSVTGQIMGTLAYMSPEQAAGRPDQIDLRSDVYGLGVVLYELLTGQFPYDVTGPMATVLTTIQQVEPKRPSMLRRQIDDEVETIVMKALAKEKGRRYITAGALGQDVIRYLAGDPIEAKRDSVLYVLRKTLRRYKAPVAVTAAFAFVLVASSIVAWGLYVEADRASREAEAERAKAQASADTLERTTYFQRVGLAWNAYQAYDIGRFKELLDQCEPKLRGWEWRLLNVRRHLIERTIQTVEGEPPTKFCAVGPDNAHVVSFFGNTDRSFRVWNLNTGKVIKTLQRGLEQASAVAYSPDGRFIATGSDRGLVLFDAEKPQELRTIEAHEGRLVKSIAFRPDGIRAVSADEDGHIFVWDTDTGEVHFPLLHPRLDGRGGSGWTESVAWSPDGKWIASNAPRTLWLAEEGAFVRNLAGRYYTAMSVAFSPDSQRIVVSLASTVLGLWDVANADADKLFYGHTSPVLSAAFSPDGETIVSGGADNTIKLWEPATGRVMQTFRGHEGRVWGVTFTRDGKRILSYGERTVRAWPVAARAEPQRLNNNGVDTDDLFSIAYSPDGKWVAAGGHGDVFVWNRSSGRLQRKLNVAEGTGRHGFLVYGLAFSPDGSKLAAGAGEFWAGGLPGLPPLPPEASGVLKLWEVGAWTEHPPLGDEALEPIWSLAFSPDGNKLAVGGFVYDLERRTEPTKLPAAGDRVSVAFSPAEGQEWLAIAGDNGIQLLNTQTGDVTAPFNTGQETVFSLAFDATGGRLAACTHVNESDWKIHVWDMAEFRRTLTRPFSRYASVSLSPNGDRVVANSGDGSLRMWDTATGEEALNFGRRTPYFSVAFSPDGRQLATANQYALELWNTDIEPADPAVEE